MTTIMEDIALAIFGSGAPAQKPTEWAHGWETKFVRATRYYSPNLGLHVGFSLPAHPLDCDRADIIDWLRSKGVRVYQCGGYPGAAILGVVDGVHDIESVNQWLPNFLPDFHRWIEQNLK